MNEAPAVASVLAALRAGRAVQVGACSVLSVETASDAMLALLDPQARAPVLISADRAAALNLANRREAAEGGPVAIVRSPWLDRQLVRSLVDPAHDVDRIVPGPIEPDVPGDKASATAALELARLAGVLPALWLVQSDAVAAVTPKQVFDAARSRRAEIVARARLPLAGLDDTQMVAFRNPADGGEHVALLVGAPAGRPPLVRLHSECLTGDVFGSLKCDCGPQLQAALGLIGTGGILLYLRQEGRGIGLVNKLRAYALQDRGLDTVEANRRLGFADDARDYSLAAAMLRALGHDRVRLLTNNPAKVRGLEEAGITVAERVAHHMPANPHNADYLETKQTKSGHLP
ncbi:MAG: GTP cyclohydrolase II [uncultured Sphingomonas sp.]|uniref:GTP cyclohydrolase-2 n=1 Tax=uncultured Sphingomonas sp. TaxID=158754 RepID=A0A6J4SRY6_9SPHN|nr:GTP cyclohydrolase II [uncultured Sphingomonas sp.]CAA9503714.1 MAG: GTP cyclohydrolase II [uncultured Sphingomonas sp.]